MKTPAGQFLKYKWSVFQALNHEELILSVVVNLKGQPHIFLFDTRAFVAFKNDLQKIKPFLQVKTLFKPFGNFIKKNIAASLISLRM
jgi:hypothetical protein